MMASMATQEGTEVRTADEGAQVRLPSRGQVLQGVAGFAIAFALIFWGLPWVAQTSWSEIGHEVLRYRWYTVVELCALSLLAMWLYSYLFTACLPRLGRARAMQMNLASTAVGNTLPGGGIVGVGALYMMARSYGFSRRDVTGTILVSSAWSFMARTSLPIFALLWILVMQEHLPASVVPFFVTGAVLGGLTCLGMVAWLRLDGPGQWLSRVFAPVLVRIRRRGETRGECEQSVLRLRERMRQVVGTHAWTMTLTQAGMLGVSYLGFWVALHALSVDIPIAWSFAAFAGGRLMTVLPLTPGDVGVTETVTLAVLIGAGADPAASAAATVVFSLVTTWLATPLGVVAWLTWWLKRR